MQRNKFLNVTCVAAILILSVAAGCQKQNDQAPVAAGQSTNSDATQIRSGEVPFWKGWNLTGYKPVKDDEQALAWAENLQLAAQTADLTAFDRLIEFRPMNNYIVADIENKRFRNGFLSGLNSIKAELGGKMFAEDGSYKFLRLKKTSRKAPGVIFRLLTPEGGCNYHQWDLLVDGSGNVYGADVYVMLSGERLSTTMKRMSAVLSPGKPSILASIMGQEKLSKADQKKVVAFFTARQSGQPKNVLAAYENLPKQIRIEKSISLARVLSTLQLEDESHYYAALEDHRKLFPDDASADLLSIDLSVNNGEYDLMQASIERMMKFTGPDAYLLGLRGLAYAGSGQEAKAIEAYRSAIDLEPDCDFSYWGLNTLHIENERYDEAFGVLKSLVDEFESVEFDFSDPRFKEWIKTPQHGEILEYAKQKRLDSTQSTTKNQSVRQ